MTYERCSSCGRPLLWSAGRLICGNVNCTTGHVKEHQLSLVDCNTETCTARVSVEEMPGGYCGECFRRLPSDVKRQAVNAQRRGEGTRHTTKAGLRHHQDHEPASPR